MISNSTPTRNPWVHRWAWVLACAAFCLIAWGGLVTATGTGVAVRNWIAADGTRLSFLSTGDSLIAYGQRLLGMAVGILALGLGGIIRRNVHRDWIRRLGWLIVAAAIVVVTLIELRPFADPLVIAFLQSYAGPLLFAMCITLVVVTSGWWHDAITLPATASSLKLARLAALTAVLSCLQIFVGGLMRHTPNWSNSVAGDLFQAAVYVHLLLATGLLVLVSLVVGQALRSRMQRGLAVLLAGLLGLQILLGVLTWMARYSLPAWAVAVFGQMRSANTADGLWQMLLATSHVAAASLTMATSLALALRIARQIRWAMPLLVRGEGRSMAAVPGKYPQVGLRPLLTTVGGFFAVLIAGYFVLRLAVPSWPSPGDVRLVRIWGIASVLVLIGASRAARLAVKTAKVDETVGAKGWVLLSFLLGLVFLGIRAYEYDSKVSQGVFFGGSRRQIFDEPDVYYAQAVRLRLIGLKADIENKTDRTDMDQQRLDLLDGLLRKVDAAEVRLRNEPNLPDGWIPLAQLAEEIFPRASVIESGEATRTAEGEAPTVLASDDSPHTRGLNEKHHWLRLPVVVPGGRAWAGTFLLLTGFHGLLVLVGLSVLATLLSKSLDQQAAESTEKVALYWRFANLTGMILFALFYLF
jgi:cytochrome c oxidase subunit 3